MRSLCLCALVCLTAGCNLTKFVADSMLPQLKNNQDAFFSERSTRHAREAAPALISFADGFIQSSPENPELLLMGAELRAGMATVMIRYEDDRWAGVLYEKAQSYAARALAVDYPELLAAIRGNDEGALDKALAEADAGAVPHLFWHTLAAAGRTDLARDRPDLVADLSKHVKVMERVVALDEEFFDGGPHLFLGQFYISRSETLGGDLEKARVHFEKAERIASNRMLLVPVFYAEGLRNQKLSQENRDAYEAALRRVLDAGEGPPERALLTALAKEKAAVMLAEIDTHFDPVLIELLSNQP